jgi:hypothetical protein
MKKTSEADLKDDLLPEYDFHALRVVARGPGRRKNMGEVTIQLAPDVAEVFPDAQSVNEALRFLMRVTRQELSHSDR